MIEIWQSKTNSPINFGVYAAVSVTTTDKVYVAPTGTATIYEWDPSTNAWTQKANSTQGTIPSNSRSFAIGTNVYFPFANSVSFIMYDSSANTWATKTNTPQAISAPITFSIGTKGYYGVGGGNVNLYEYDSINNSWSTKQSYTGIAQYNLVGFSIGSKGYAGTGETGGGASQKDFWEFDPLVGWTQKLDFGGAVKTQASAFSIGTKGYIGLGTLQGSTDFWEYDSIANTWVQKSNFSGTARYAARGFSIGNKGYVVGGQPGGNQLWERSLYLEAPTNLVATVLTMLSVKLDWTDNATGESNYVIERRRNDEADYSILATIAAGTITYTDNTIDLTLYSYWYRVKAVVI